MLLRSGSLRLVALTAGLLLSALGLVSAGPATAAKPTPLAPVTVATGPGWTLQAWKSTTRGLCVSHQPRPTFSFCTAPVMRRAAMMTAGVGPPRRSFVLAGVVTRAVAHLYLIDKAARRPVHLYTAPTTLDTHLRFFRIVVNPRGANPTGIRWMLSAFDRDGHKISFTGQGRSVG